MTNGYYETLLNVQFLEQEGTIGDMGDSFAVIRNDSDSDHVFMLGNDNARELLMIIMNYLDEHEDKVSKVGL